MRGIFFLISPLLIVGAASAQVLSVAKGQWTVSTDIYFEGTVDGADADIAPEFVVENACLSLTEEVEFTAESLVQAMAGCHSAGSRTTTYSVDVDLVCDFEGVPMKGPAALAVSEGGNSFLAWIRLKSDYPDVDIDADMVMIGHRTGACAP